MHAPFCVIYQWFVKEGTEAQFSEAWESLTAHFRDNMGGLGSRLHRAEDGRFVAYAQWPDRQTWENASADSDNARSAGERMARCVESRIEPVLLDVVADRLIQAHE